jgi:two-component system OmpR family response regulator
MLDEAGGRAVRLLVVEDDDELRAAMVRCLTRAGFLVTAAATGADAVEAAREIAPDAVVMDVLLPDAGGLGVARKMRRERTLESVPVLFMTALSLPTMREALSPAPVLFKPFTQRQLLSCVREVTRFS